MPKLIGNGTNVDIGKEYIIRFYLGLIGTKIYIHTSSQNREYAFNFSLANFDELSDVWINMIILTEI